MLCDLNNENGKTPIQHEKIQFFNKKKEKKFDISNYSITFALSVEHRDTSIAGIRIDRDTHQITTENREGFAYQWRATPFGVT
jgi:hypothetical protein